MIDPRVGHLRLLWAMVVRWFYPGGRLWVKGDDGLWHDAETWETRQ